MGRGLLAAVAALVFCGTAAAHTDGEPQVLFDWPAQGIVTSPFGNDHGRWHPGLDIGVLRSLDVIAAAGGVVEAVGEPAGFEGYGNVVLVRVSPTLETLYAHLAAEDVRAGDYVAEGARLGTAGCTGWCTGTHLHFEVRVSGRAVHPLQFLG
jgi:murein DD-endopeptidase MepM/ murein hydrolase activator NlpD